MVVGWALGWPAARVCMRVREGVHTRMCTRWASCARGWVCRCRCMMGPHVPQVGHFEQVSLMAMLYMLIHEV